MHLLNTRPGGFVEDETAIVCLNQTPAEMVVLSSADTTLSLLAAAQGELLAAGAGAPALRLANVLHLRQNASFDRYADEVLRHARVIVVDHLGAESAWPYGIAQLAALARQQGQALALFSGDLTEDPGLLARGTLPAETARLLWRYLRAGGAANARAFLQAVAFHGLGRGAEPPPPRPLPPVALHAPPAWAGHAAEGDALAALQAHWHAGAPVAALVFYRSHLLAGNTAAFDDLALALHAQGLNPLPLALDSLKDPLCLATLRRLCAEHAAQIVLNTTAFAALGQAAGDARSEPAFEPLAGDAPVLQVIVSGSDREGWLQDSQGLRPRDIAMQVVLPEVDGRLITRAISFKAGTRRCPHTQVDVVHYQSEPDRVAFVAELAARWCRLRQLPAPQKRLALVLANYPGSEGRIGSGVGLDTPASVIGLLRLLHSEGYDLGDAAHVPADGNALMRRLTEGVANDPAQWPLRPAFQSYALADYRARLARLPAGMADAIAAQWGPPEADPLLRQGRFMVAGLRLGKVFIGIQPARALADDGSAPARQDYASYHSAELAPPHHYLAFYFWLRDVWAADAIAHVGKHGNLEWLPGKSLALSSACWPDTIFGPLPHIYPFIVNDPGEGAQAKRRTQAALIGHLMPPLTRAENHGPMQELERLVDEYYDALLLDARRAPLLRRHILQLARQQNLAQELPPAAAASSSAGNAADDDDDALLTRIDAYLCELKESQIRDGLHIFGQSPTGRQRRDTLLALARFASVDTPANAQGQAAEGLLHALAADWLGAGFDPLAADPALPWHGPRPAALQALSPAPWRHHGHTRERLELLAAHVLDAHLQDDPLQSPPLQSPTLPSNHASSASKTIAANPYVTRANGLSDSPPFQPPLFDPAAHPRTRAALQRITQALAPRLDACGPQELLHFSRALQGRFVPPGPSGSPTRGRPDVLPTGRNFCTIDTRAIPTRTAWALGEQAAQRLIERHLQDHGDWPRAIGISVWGTATMRTGGDDIAQALALIGVRPRWAPGSDRVSDFEVIPRVGLHRPRVDVTLRISGLFRDAFPATVQLFDAAVQAVAAQDGEDEADNPIRARIQQDSAALQAQGMSETEARQQAGWRIFGPPPGHYGSGLDALFQHPHTHRWDSDADLAHAYTAWSAHAYGQGSGAGDESRDARHMLPRRLAELDAVLHNQDSREHDLLDSADYYLFQGGMAAAARHHSGGQPPALYHGDHSQPQRPRVRSLQEEIGRVVRARATNPKWIQGAMRHGYKGAFEMAATVDYLFGFDATCRIVGDQHWAALTDAYVRDDTTRAFIEQHNPQALTTILARLREAIARGLWQQPGDYAHWLDDMALAHDERMEGR